MTNEKLPKGYICWSADGLDLIESDVGKIKSDENSDESIIHAVHQHVDVQVKINEVNASISSILEGGRKNPDTKIVDAFLASIEKDDIGSVLMSIVGENGSGKSHLVRWLYHEIEPNEEKYIKLWVPRRENAQKYLIKKLIDDLAALGSTRAVELRAKLELTVRESKDSPQAVAASLYSAIVDELQFEPTLREDITTEGVEYRRMFLGDVGDQSTQRFLWQVLNDVKNEEGNLADTLTAHLKLVVESISQLGSEEHGESQPVLDERRVEKLLKAYQRVVKEKLQRNAYEYLFNDALSNLSTITSLINEAIELSVNRVLSVEGTNIREVFSEVREELAKHGKMLLIFVEDFSAISGSNAGLGKLQRDLMAMFTESTDGELAPIRVAMAVTKQTFGALESNFQQRIHFIIKIDEAFEELEVEPFIASYLRLARTNKIELNNRRSNAKKEDLDSGNWVPNKCETCSYRDECFDVFGQENGIGFYPLTQHALKRVTDHNKSTPRERISRLKNVLMAVQGDLAREIMPSQAVELNFGPNSGTAEWDSDRNEMLRIEFGLGDAIQGETKLRLQRYIHNWADGKRPSDTEFRVFGLPPFIGFADGNQGRASKPETERVKTVQTQRVSSDIQRDLDRINRWLQAEKDEDLGRIFSANLESSIRRSIVSEVTAAFGRQFTGATLGEYAQQIGLRFVEASIRIEGVPVQDVDDQVLLRPYFNIPRNEQGADVLRGILYIEAIKNGVHIDSEIPVVRRPLLLAATGLFIRDAVERLTKTIQEYELINNSITDVTVRLLYLMQQINPAVNDLAPQDLVARWLNGELEVDEPIGKFSQICFDFFGSMSELRNSIRVLHQVTQEEKTTKDLPHFWRTVNLSTCLKDLTMTPREALISIDRHQNAEQKWFQPILATLNQILDNVEESRISELNSTLHEHASIISVNFNTDLRDQLDWVETNLNALMSQSVFRDNTQNITALINKILHTQFSKDSELGQLTSRELDVDLVLTQARSIDQIFDLAEAYRTMATHLRFAINRLVSMSTGNVSSVVQSVIDFEKLTSESGVLGMLEN